MKVLVAIDSLKGSLTSIEAGNSIKQGILNVCQNASVEVVPLADGGEGTVEALAYGMNGEVKEITVTGPLSEKVKAKYGLLKNEKTAIIEMAQSSGLPLVCESLRNPLNTTTFGMGEVIKDAINEGCRNFIIGLGGSATNDCGVGMLQALGFEFYDENDNLVGLGGKVLNNIKRINTSNKLKELDECYFEIACDVTNPLYGKNGASYIYGPQKGATPEIVETLNDGMINFSNVVEKTLNKFVSEVEGAGAAGGLGYGFLAFLNTNLKSGIDIVLEKTKLEEKIKNVDIVITGEGKLDYQTAMGKGPIGVAKLGKKHNKKVIGLAGAIDETSRQCNNEGIDAYFSITNTAMSLEVAMDKEVATKNMILTTEQIFRLINAFN